MSKDQFFQTLASMIIKAVGEGFNTTQLISEYAKASRGYTRTVLSRGAKVGTILKMKDPEDKRRNLYDPTDEPFQHFRFTLRIIDTSSLRVNKHAWDFQEDIEATVSGIVPIGTTEEDIRSKLTDELKVKMLVMLEDEGIFLTHIPLDRITFKKAEDKGISGVALESFTDKPSDELKVEIVFTNNIGKVYIFTDKIQTRLSEFGK